MKRVKRIIGLLALAVILIGPSLVFASGKTGVYVAPKFAYGYLMGYDLEDYRWAYSYGDLVGGERNSDRAGRGDHIFGGALAVGYDFSKRLNVPVRGELEYAIFSDAKTKEGNVDWGRRLDIGIQTIFANVYYDFRNTSAFTPYFGLGLGMALVKAKGEYPGDFSLGSKTTTNFAWNIGAGVAYAFTDMISLDLAYRFVSPGKGKTKKDISYVYDPDFHDRNQWKTSELYIHQFMLGVRFTF